MTKYTFFSFVFLIIGAGFIYYTFMLYDLKLKKIESMDDEILQQEEKLISAQLLNREVKEVANLIEKNLAMSAADSLVQERALNFLKYLTPLLDKYKIILLAAEPNRSVTETARFHQTTHDLHILCNYTQFGKFVAELERSERVTSIRSFDVMNNPHDYLMPDEEREIEQHEIKMTITTLTLIKEVISYETGSI